MLLSARRKDQPAAAVPDSPAEDDTAQSASAEKGGKQE